MASALPQLDNSEYNVGWIAALPHERAAAEAMLDKEHAPPQHKHENDHNIYTLGSVNNPNGEHRVVIASLPKGRYGITPAATAAIQMLSSFPAIKFGLMVGIGGGIPSSNNDIRLGDVVVSQPEGTFGGVRQYDCGKAAGDGFKERGALNSPPRVLLNAMGALQSKHERRGTTAPEILQVMYMNFPVMAKPRDGPGYVYQGANNDRLFHSDHEHQSNEKNCSACDGAKEVIRPERSDQDPYIHYGTIASGNAIIKDARMRDLISGDCLCFETEAAGLMNDFPCLVIRGICDYCDSHKNDQWQKYAAATAAAYAKELLQTTDLADVKGTPEAREVMHQLQKVLENVTNVQQHIEEGLKSFREGQKESERLEILKWITKIDYGSKYSDILTRRYDGTGQWLLDSPEYQTWLKTKGQTLFCPGIPGAGKTVLAAIVIDDLYTKYGNDPRIGIAYLFCDYKSRDERSEHQSNDEQRLEHLLLSLLKQLSQRQCSIPNSVKELYNLHKNRTTRPSIKEMTNLLQIVATSMSAVFIVVDALDECQTADGCRMDFISEILALQNRVGARIFATSRYIDEITRCFDGCISLNIRATDEDVKIYLGGQMRRFRQDTVDHAIQREIELEVSGAANGMFLLAALHMNRLVDLPTRGDIKKALQSIAHEGNNLEAAYKKTMVKIERQDADSKSLAKRTLAWIIHARRHFSTEELRYALAVKKGTKKLDEDDIPSASVLLSICAGLVQIDDKQGIIRLAHHTTLEFFMHAKQDWLQYMQTDIAKSCITYLLFDCFQAGPCQTDQDTEARLQTHIFYDYAARNWGHHVRTSLNEESNLLALDLLENENIVSACSQAIGAGSHNLSNRRKIARQTTGLHLATYFGLEESVVAILAKGADVNSKDSNGRTPMGQAAELGHEAVIKALLDKGADPNIEDNDGKTPALAALMNGYGQLGKLIMWKMVGQKSVNKLTLRSAAVQKELETEVKMLLENDVDLDAEKTWLYLTSVMGREADMKLLLEKGVDPKVKDNKGQTLLHAAVAAGQEAVVKLLLESDVDPEAKDNNSQTPLYVGAQMEQAAVVKLLLEKGVDPDVKNKYGQTPLHEAARMGQIAVVELLMDRGVDVDAKDNNGQTPLHAAVTTGQVAVVKLLLENGANAEVKSKDGQTPLYVAVMAGQEAVVKLLLEKEVDPDVKDNNGFMLLFPAIAMGQAAIIKLLLEKGINPEVKYNNGLTPFYMAVMTGQVAIVKLLLEKGVDPKLKDDQGRTPLHAAVAAGQEAVVKLLLESDVDPEAKDNNGQTPLYVGAQTGQVAVVKLLLEKGAYPEVKDNDGYTPLYMAAKMGQIAVVKLLVDRGVDVDAKDNSGQTPLLLAAQTGQGTVVQLLLDKGANVEEKDINYGQTSLRWAAQNGHEAVLQLLIEKGANIEAKDNEHGLTSLAWAAENGQTAVVKSLLDEGADVEAKDSKYGQTPLSWAAQRGNEAIVALLLDKSNVRTENTISRTPLSLAAKGGHDTIVMALLSHHSVEIDRRDYYGSTPLSIAVRNNRTEIVNLLLATGQVNVDSRDRFGRTLFSWVGRFGNPDIEKTIRKYAEERGVKVCKSNEFVDASFMSGTKTSKECDVCTLSILKHQVSYHCDLCQGGDYDICSECYEIGGRCLGDDHSLTRIIDS